jgi:hypothetical protein
MTTKQKTAMSENKDFSGPTTRKYSGGTPGQSSGRPAGHDECRWAAKQFSPIAGQGPVDLRHTIALLETLSRTEEDAEVVHYMKRIGAGEIPAELPRDIFIRTATAEMALCKFLHIAFRPKDDYTVDILVGGKSCSVRIVDHPDDPLCLESLGEFQTDILVVACPKSPKVVALTGWVDQHYFVEHCAVGLAPRGTFTLKAEHLRPMEELLRAAKKGAQARA